MHEVQSWRAWILTHFKSLRFGNWSRRISVKYFRSCTGLAKDKTDLDQDRTHHPLEMGIVLISLTKTFITTVTFKWNQTFMFRIEGNLEDLRSSEIIISVLATAPQIHNQIVESQPKLPSIMGQNTKCKRFLTTTRFYKLEWVTQFQFYLLEKLQHPYWMIDTSDN